MHKGLEIGIYAHEDPNLNALHQHIYILYMELAAIEHGQVDPMSPGAYGSYNQFE